MSHPGELLRSIKRGVLFAPRNSLARLYMIAARMEDSQSLTQLLKGVFAYSYSGYHAASLAETPAPPSPEIGSYLERTRPAATVDRRRGWQPCDEIDGYVLVDYVGWVDFHGDGRLSGGGTFQRAGACAVPFTHSGSYTVENAQPPMLTGNPVPHSCVILTHAAESGESGRELRFTVLDRDAGHLVAAGTLAQE